LAVDPVGAVAVVTDDPGWHGIRLLRAFKDRGFDGAYVSLTACRLNLDSPGLPVIVPGFEQVLPDGVFVRGVPGGTLDEVVFYLDILHALRLLGVPVYNDAAAIERTVDKGMTSFRLRQAGIPAPPTWVCTDREQAMAIAVKVLRDGHQLVSKPLFGSQGEGLRRYEKLEHLAGLDACNGVYYLQRFVDCGAAPHDFRVFVINGKAVAAMRRSGLTWLNNVAQGARCETARLDRFLCGLAEDAVRALEMSYAGVDIIRDAQGRHSVVEINSVPAWKGLQGVCDVDVTALLADDFLRHCRARLCREAAG
jgi:tetrahydromethanopterin:alpha-L-glutamate ligase